MSEAAESRIAAARWPQDLAVARVLLRSYETHLLSGPAGASHIRIDGYDDELAHLPEHWGGSDASLLLAWHKGEAVGCVAVRLLPDRPGACELKRMWVDPKGRGTGLGRALLHAAIAWSREHGAHELLLDTAPEAMPEAGRLYAAAGFAPCPRYNTNPVPGIVFLRLPLSDNPDTSLTNTA